MEGPDNVPSNGQQKVDATAYGRPSPAPRSAQLAAEDADDFEMRAVPELVHRRDPLEAVAAGDEDRGIAHEGPGIAGDADDDRDFLLRRAALPVPPPRRAGDRSRARRNARAPVRGAGAGRGRAPPSRRGAGPAFGARPCRGRQASGASPSTAWTSARSARRSAKGPQPAKRSATRFALWHASTTTLASASSPAWVACRKPPGAGESWALPMRRSGARRSTSTSPWSERRARSCRPATSISA